MIELKVQATHLLNKLLFNSQSIFYNKKFNPINQLDYYLKINYKFPTISLNTDRFLLKLKESYLQTIFNINKN